MSPGHPIILGLVAPQGNLSSQPGLFTTPRPIAARQIDAAHAEEIVKDRW
jgi:hypothetical protein